MGVFSQINNCQQKKEKKPKQTNKQNKKRAPLLGLAKSIYYVILTRLYTRTDVF